MKKTPRLSQQARLRAAPLLFAALALSAAVGLAQDGPAAISPTPPAAPPELVKPVLPSELQRAESVFRKLDVAQRGYVTLDDTKDLIGFEAAFRSADGTDSGKLSLAQFRKAWANYTAKK